MRSNPPLGSDAPETERRTHSRRTFVSLLAGAGVGTLAGCAGTLSSPTTVGASRAVGPDATGMTDGERADFVGRMSETYGAAAAELITPRESSAARVPQPGATFETLVWDATEALTAGDSNDSGDFGNSGDSVVASDNYAALYETDLNGEDDDRYYVHWLWSSAHPRSGADGTDGTISTVWNHIDLTNGADITVYDPAGDRSTNGTVGPHPDRTGQDTDEFAVRWKGGHDDAITVTGSCVERRAPEDDTGFDWNVHLDGRP